MQSACFLEGNVKQLLPWRTSSLECVSKSINPQIPEHFRLNRLPTKKPGREKMPAEPIKSRRNGHFSLMKTGNCGTISLDGIPTKGGATDCTWMRWSKSRIFPGKSPIGPRETPHMSSMNTEGFTTRYAKGENIVCNSGVCTAQRLRSQCSICPVVLAMRR